jgi:hypothetical protein
MGNELTKKSTSKYILDQKTFKRLEKDLLEFSGLQSERIIQKSVRVDLYKNKQVENSDGSIVVRQSTISTIIIGDDSKPPLVWLHGYGAAGALFYRIMEGLSHRFQIFFVDLIGMGGSSRSDDFNKNYTA